MVEKIVYRWYERAQVDYGDMYMKLYVSFNAWYRKTTGSDFDREALRILEKRFVIWDDYIAGHVLRNLKVFHEKITGDTTDWQRLISYWYQVRCQLFHGSSELKEGEVRLAYESLNIFMDEIVRRMKRSFTDEDYLRLEEVEQLLSLGSPDSKYLRVVQQELHQKYINAPSLWNVDMVRVIRAEK